MEYKTERGMVIEIIPIPLLLEKVREGQPEPPRPTYTEHLAGGGVQEQPITDQEAETWAKKDPDTWKEHAAEWEAYQKAVAERAERLNDLVWRAVLRKSIRAKLPTKKDGTEDTAWAEEQRNLGIAVPDEPSDRLAHYIWTECIGGTKDVVRITAIAHGADLTEEALAAAEASFQRSLQVQTPVALETAKRTVAPGKSVRPASRRKSVGHKTK